jgi:hypothetical protein
MSDSTILLRRGLDEFQLCRKLEDCGGSPTALRFYETVSAVVFLRSCITDPEQERKLRLWLQATPFFPVSHSYEGNDLFEKVAKMIVSGEVKVASQEGQGRGKGIIRSGQNPNSGANPSRTTPLQDERARQQSAATEEEPIVLGETEQETEKTWIEIELVDDDGKPVRYERYKLTLPDGSVKWGRLDDSGKARVERLQAGNCQLTFPDRDQKVWDVG